MAIDVEVEDDVFFRVNFKQFTMYFRNEVCSCVKGQQVALQNLTYKLGHH